MFEFNGNFKPRYGPQLQQKCHAVGDGVVALGEAGFEMAALKRVEHSHAWDEALR